MAKSTVAQWSTTAANNTDVGGIGIQGSNTPANLDDAIREIMAQIAQFVTNAGFAKAGFGFGTAAAPSIYFTGDTDTGLYRSATNTIDFTTEGMNRLSLSKTGLASSVPISSKGDISTEGVFRTLNNDTAAAPGYSWTGDTNTGMWNAGADAIGFATGGVNRATLDSTALELHRLRLTVTTDASLSSTGHAFQIGPTNGGNLIIDGNEVMSRNNGAADGLHLNADGGDVTVNGNSVWHGGNAATNLAGMSHGSVGTYALLGVYGSTQGTVTQGQTLAGSALSYSGYSGTQGTQSNFEVVQTGSSPAGTWKCMGRLRGGASDMGSGTLWLRIS